MGEGVIGVLHPGAMGAAVAGALRMGGTGVLWASSGRSAETVERARAAGLRDAVTTGELARRADVILSVCPPHAALEVARSVSAFDGIFVDANAVSPATAREIADVIEAGGGRFVDGGIVGPPPSATTSTTLYLSGADALRAAGVFAGTSVDARLVSERPGDASAVKMAFAAWTKGTAALLLAVRALARAEGVEETLLEEWRASLPDLPERSRRAARSAASKGWRWVGEMEEIAATFASSGLPTGFHEAAAEVFRRIPTVEASDGDTTLDRVLAGLTGEVSARP